MKITSVFPKAFSTFAFFAVGGANAGAVSSDIGIDMPARLIVRYETSAAAASTDTGADTQAIVAVRTATAQVQRLSTLTGKPMKLLRTLASGALLVDAGSGLDAAGLDQLAAQIRRGAPAGLRYVEPDRLLQATFTPNDPLLSSQWGLAGPAQGNGVAGVNAYSAWDRTDGSGAIVGVIDTGYRPHADLASQVIAQYDFISDSANANDGNGRDASALDPGDFRISGSCGSAGTSNSSWHGTHVAGTVAAITNNGLGVAGVAYGAKLVIARVLGRCGGYTSDISDAIIWTSGGTVSGVPANPSPAQVINMSLGGQYPCSASPEMQNAIDSARSRNTTVVVAAGNSAADASGFSPASCSGVIAVASVGSGGSRAPYSNYGSTVDVAAPGGDSSLGTSGTVLSTYNSGATTPGADSYAYLQGTSMASPHVAGVAALLYAAQASLTPDAVEAAIKNNTRSFPGSCSGCGTGLVDANLALASLAPSAGKLSFSAATYSVAENGGSATITVQRGGGSAGAVTVAYATSNGTAVAGSDYTAASGTLSWADSDSAAKTFSVQITDDSAAEATETVNLTISAPGGGATLGTIRTAQLSIADNDSAPGTLAFAAASYSVAEAAGSVVVSVTRTGGSYGAASVAYTTANSSATAGNDYTATSGTLTWASGDTASKTIRIPILNDTLAEPSEVIQVRLSAPTGATLGSVVTTSITIIDDDTVNAAGSLAFLSTVASVAENAGSATIVVRRSGGSVGAVTVAYASSNGSATAGSDYTAVSGTLSWGAGDVSNKSFTVPITDDSAAESSETLFLTLSNATGGATLGSAKTLTLTIADNDSSPGVFALTATSYSVSEGAGAVKIAISRSGGATGSASISYATANSSALAGKDFVAVSGTLVWANNDATTKTISVPILNDTVKEGTETFQVRLSSPVAATLGSQSLAAVTIVDND